MTFGQPIGVYAIRCIVLFTVASAGRAIASADSERLTGCLNLRSGGQYILTEEKAARVITVIGESSRVDLLPHGHNHRVTVTGTLAKEQGRDVFKASAIQHLDDRCP
jgi:hypothetical protein